jgi:hypothetical protein
MHWGVAVHGFANELNFGFGRHRTLKQQLADLLSGRKDDPFTAEAFSEVETEPGTILAYVPPFIAGSVLGDQLAWRILHCSWQPLTFEDIDAAWQRPVPIGELLDIQKFMHIKRGDSVPAVCGCCNRRAKKRCGICLSIYYCSPSCQHAHWVHHRHSCKLPNPKIQGYVSVTLPDYSVAFQYVQWMGGGQAPGDIGVCIENKDTWIRIHGEDTMRRTILNMAVHGKPAIVMCRVFAEK